MSKISRRAPVLLVCLLAAVVVLSGGKLITDEALENGSAAQYKLTPVERGAFVKEMQRNSELYYPRTATLRAEESNARLVEIHTRTERSVSEGDALASYRIEESLAEKTRLDQELNRAEVQYASDKEALAAREEALVTAISGASDPIERELLMIDREILALEAEQRALTYAYDVRQLSDEIKKKEERIEGHQLLAPFDGVVRSVSSRKSGDTINPWDALVQLYANDYFLLKVDDSLGQFRYNMPVEINVGPRNDRTHFTGRVVAADNVLPEELRTGAAYVKFDDIGDTDAKQMLFPEIIFNAFELYDVLVASKKAVTLEKGSQFVSILEEDTVKKRMINVGLTGLDMCLILGGLSEGEQLILK